MTTDIIDNTPLGTRMKRYEQTYQQTTPRRAYTLMRLDGRAFHSYLRHAEKPFDPTFVQHMDEVAVALCKEIQGARFAYTQSDEVSLLLTDFDSPQSEPWFGGRVDKMTSISASIASVVMHERRRSSSLRPQFDCRVWSMSDPVEVANYFVWRQRDAVRNSIQMLGQHHFTQAELHCKNTDEIQEMLFQKHRVKWSFLDPEIKRGRVVAYAAEAWRVSAAPHFTADPDSWLADVIPPLPTLWS